MTTAETPDRPGAPIDWDSIRARLERLERAAHEALDTTPEKAHAVLEAWRVDYNDDRPHSRLRWMSPSIYAAERRSAALRSTDGSAQRNAAITAQAGITTHQTPIPIG